MTATWIQAFEVDSVIDAILTAKQDRIDMILEGRRKTLRGVGTTGQEIAQQVMGILMS